MLFYSLTDISRLIIRVAPYNMIGSTDMVMVDNKSPTSGS